jgi:hypothetical protein
VREYCGGQLYEGHVAGGGGDDDDDDNDDDDDDDDDDNMTYLEAKISEKNSYLGRSF